MALNKVICPECAGIIELDPQMEYGYCIYCGDKIRYADAASLQLSKTLMADKAYLSQLNPEVLLLIAKTQKPVNSELLRIAADKGHKQSALLLGMILRQGDAKAKKEALRYLEPIQEKETADAQVLYLILMYETSNMDKREVHKRLCPLRNARFIYTENQNVCIDYISRLYQQISIEDAPKYTYLDLPTLPSDAPSSDGAGAYAYPDVYGPSYNPSTNGPPDSPWSINSGEIW